MSAQVNWRAIYTLYIRAGMYMNRKIFITIYIIYIVCMKQVLFVYPKESLYTGPLPAMFTAGRAMITNHTIQTAGHEYSISHPKCCKQGLHEKQEAYSMIVHTR